MPTSYKDAGVDLDAGNEFVNKIRPKAIATLRAEVIAHLGGFAGCFALPTGYKEPVIVSSVDGVGTKVLLATTEEYLQNIGQDLVAMVVNDIICTGADPLFFLDYYASSKLDPEQADWLFEGIRDALDTCNMTLLGGESAEMPGMYQPEHFDVAGFGVGMVDRRNIINGHESVREDDIIIGIESSGPHSNGYSLIRKILSDVALKTSPEEFAEIHDKVMAASHLYPPTIKAIKEAGVPIKAIANITGGGLLENLPRVVDVWWRCVIDPASWDTPDVFWWLMKNGPVHMQEMYRVFNMGIGITIIVDPQYEKETIAAIEGDGFQGWKIGVVTLRNNNEPPVLIT